MCFFLENLTGTDKKRGRGLNNRVTLFRLPVALPALLEVLLDATLALHPNLGQLGGREEEGQQHRAVPVPAGEVDRGDEEPGHPARGVQGAPPDGPPGDGGGQRHGNGRPHREGGGGGDRHGGGGKSSSASEQQLRVRRQCDEFRGPIGCPASQIELQELQRPRPVRSIKLDNQRQQEESRSFSFFYKREEELNQKKKKEVGGMEPWLRGRLRAVPKEAWRRDLWPGRGSEQAQ